MNQEIESTIPPHIPQKKGLIGVVTREIILFAVIAIGIVLPFRMFVAEPYIVEGSSMDPTFKTSDYLIVDKLSYRISTPERNSVVVLKYPNDESKNFLKRIIGLPGDTVILTPEKVTITNIENPNGIIINQPYIVHPCKKGAQNKCVSSLTQTLGPGEYFVMGDNRSDSYDSRGWGVLPEKDIVGKPILRLFPLTKISILPGNTK